MERTLRAYLNRARDGGAEPDAERAAVVSALLARLRTAPDPEAEVAPAWQRIADWWLHVIRPAWQAHLGDRRRNRFARLRDLRRPLQQSPIATRTLRTGLAESGEQPDLGRRVVAAIVGVPADVAGEPMDP